VIRVFDKIMPKKRFYEDRICVYVII